MARGRKRFARKSGSKIWTVIMVGPNLNIAAATQTGLDIAIAADWQGAASGAENATLLSVRGYLSVVNDAATDGAFQWFICTVDEDIADTAAELDPGAAATYVDEDILLTGGYQWEASTLGNPQTWDINVKSMRKLKRGRDVRMIFLAENAAVRVTALLRGLVQTSG